MAPFCFLLSAIRAINTQSLSSACIHLRRLSTNTTPKRTKFHCQKALIVSKLTRYEFERYRQPSLSSSQLEDELRRRGSDYDTLLHHHQIHKACETTVEAALKSQGIQTKTINRLDFKESMIDWADAIFTAGGDGTFLLAAARIQDNIKPVIGINSDPTRSEGFLCLPRHFSYSITDAINRIIEGKFDWTFRQRIRITLLGDNIFDPPIELHDQQLLHPEYRYFDCLQEQHKSAIEDSTEESDKKAQKRVLPVLALNEVFMGERLSARTSYYEIRVNGKHRVKVKSSGLCVSTGTGSTSWTFSIGRLSPQSVGQVLQALQVERPGLNWDPELAHHVSERYNDSLRFDPEEMRMIYVIRDMICASVWPMPKGVLEPRGFAENLEVRSRCGDAALVIDGGVSYNFNDGTVAILELHPEDALRTITLHEH